MKIVLPVFLIFTQALFAIEVPKEIQAQSVYIFNLESLEPVLERNSDAILYPASLTKLLTGYLLSEALFPQDRLYYSRLAKDTDPYKLDLNIGEKVSAAQAMDALLVWSANDIATMIAENIGGTIYGFSELMNQEAMKLGMTHSHFVTPHGLHDPSHYTSAFDISLLLKKVYENTWMRDTMKKESVLFYENDGTSRVLKNRNKLLENIECLGGKTGWTEEAGRCLAAIFTYANQIWGGIILNTVYDYPQDTIVFQEMSSLMKMVEKMRPVSILNKGAMVKKVNVKFNLFNVFGPALDTEIPVFIESDVELTNTDLPYENSIIISEINPWALSKEKSIGIYQVNYRNFNKEYYLYSGLSTIEIIKSYWHIYLLIIGIIAAAVVMLMAFIHLFKKRIF
ncbi:MAG: D-alanyl-D-alanine carboxypeptidase [Spirochaetales bacterium]|nr:D-alanyl-D-alanine carboxypeptidase [Spirochaetales bacterium]